MLTDNIFPLLKTEIYLLVFLVLKKGHPWL